MIDFLASRGNLALADKVSLSSSIMFMLRIVNRARFRQLSRDYANLRIGIVGDFCLDRYLEIDPVRAETSIETGLPVYNVIRVRAQAGAAGSILNNLAALGIGEIFPIGFCGEDGEGMELRRALAAFPAVRLDAFLQTSSRRTFTYCKPLVLEPGRPPRELNRLDTKNWTPTPPLVEKAIISFLQKFAPKLDAIVLLDQVDIPETGVVTRRVLNAVTRLTRSHKGKCIIGDSRRGLRDWPPVVFKMNAAELASLTGVPAKSGLRTLQQTARALARRQGRMIFVTLAERGIIGATPEGETAHVPAFPLRGPIDIVGAGDSVTANLAAALAVGATFCEAIEIANTAASVVIHQLGTTGVASPKAIASLLPASRSNPRPSQ
jgi:rfaE bifunctional protein kinase chain/domain